MGQFQSPGQAELGSWEQAHCCTCWLLGPFVLSRGKLRLGSCLGASQSPENRALDPRLAFHPCPSALLSPTFRLALFLLLSPSATSPWLSAPWPSPSGQKLLAQEPGLSAEQASPEVLSWHKPPSPPPFPFQGLWKQGVCMGAERGQRPHAASRVFRFSFRKEGPRPRKRGACRRLPGRPGVQRWGWCRDCSLQSTGGGSALPGLCRTFLPQPCSSGLPLRSTVHGKGQTFHELLPTNICRNRIVVTMPMKAALTGATPRAQISPTPPTPIPGIHHHWVGGSHLVKQGLQFSSSFVFLVVHFLKKNCN